MFYERHQNASSQNVHLSSGSLFLINESDSHEMTVEEQNNSDCESVHIQKTKKPKTSFCILPRDFNIFTCLDGLKKEFKSLQQSLLLQVHNCSLELEKRHSLETNVFESLVKNCQSLIRFLHYCKMRCQELLDFIDDPFTPDEIEWKDAPHPLKLFVKNLLKAFGLQRHVRGYGDAQYTVLQRTVDTYVPRRWETIRDQEIIHCLLQLWWECWNELERQKLEQVCKTPLFFKKKLF